jgi:hypothetical protein
MAPGRYYKDDKMGFFSGLFGGDKQDYGDPMDYLNEMRPILEGYYKPYRERGLAAGNVLDEQYANLLNNPAAIQQMLGSTYQRSPGYQYQLDEALNAATMAAAAGGRLGTSSHQQEAMKTATGEANKDYWNYYNTNAGLFGAGLQGTQDLYNQGFNATQGLSNDVNALVGNQANLAYQGRANSANNFSSLLGAGIGAGGAILGGPIGGMIGTGISNWFKR